jgi:hypothetical protein
MQFPSYMSKARMERAAELLLVQFVEKYLGFTSPPFGDAPFFLDAPAAMN